MAWLALSWLSKKEQSKPRLLFCKGLPFSHHNASEVRLTWQPVAKIATGLHVFKILQVISYRPACLRFKCLLSSHSKLCLGNEQVVGTACVFVHFGHAMHGLKLGKRHLLLMVQDLGKDCINHSIPLTILMFSDTWPQPT